MLSSTVNPTKMELVRNRLVRMSKFFDLFCLRTSKGISVEELIRVDNVYVLPYILSVFALFITILCTFTRVFVFQVMFEEKDQRISNQESKESILGKAREHAAV